jgi:hypothetical protein
MSESGSSRTLFANNQPVTIVSVKGLPIDIDSRPDLEGYSAKLPQAP